MFLYLLIEKLKYRILGSLFLCSNLLCSQITFDRLNSLMKETPKPFAIYIYSDNCPYCAMQEKQLSKNTQILNLLKKDFYFVTLNSNSKEEISFNGNNYKNEGIDNYSIHQLVLAYTPKNEIVSFPCWLFFDKSNQLIFRYAGFIPSKNLTLILNSIIELY